MTVEDRNFHNTPAPVPTPLAPSTGAQPDETLVFCLYPHDIAAPACIQAWIDQARRHGCDARTIQAAVDHLETVKVWQEANGVYTPCGTIQLRAPAETAAPKSGLAEEEFQGLEDEVTIMDEATDFPEDTANAEEAETPPEAAEEAAPEPEEGAPILSDMPAAPTDEQIAPEPVPVIRSPAPKTLPVRE